MFDGRGQTAHRVRNEVALGVACNTVVASFVLQEGRSFMGFWIGFQWFMIHGIVLVILPYLTTIDAM